jgi:hypothetical protein
MQQQELERDYVSKYLRHRDAKACRQLASTSCRKESSENIFIDRFVAVAMGTHRRLGEQCQFRRIDLPGTAMLRSIAECAMILYAPGETELMKALVYALDFGWPIQVSPGTFNLGHICCSGMPCGRPLSITGFSGQEKTIIRCTWILRNSACIFEDIILQSCPHWFDSVRMLAPSYSFARY